MRSLTVAIAAAAAAFMASTSAYAGCQQVASVGDGMTKDWATVLSTHGLVNIMDNKGLTGKGPVHTRCTDGGMFGAQCTSYQTGCTAK
jgi:hypothetical protein